MAIVHDVAVYARVLLKLSIACSMMSYLAAEILEKKIDNKNIDLGVISVRDEPIGWQPVVEMN